MESASTYIQEMLHAHNEVRTKPQKYATVLEERAELFDGIYYKVPGQTKIRTKEGVKGVEHAIEFLKNQDPLSKFKLSEELCMSAQDHANDIGTNDGRGHTGSDGSKHSERIKRYADKSGWSGENISYKCGEAMDVVLRFIIDDGKEARGHRSNIFKEECKYLGVAMHDHPTWTNCVVIDYAEGVKPKGDGSKVKSKHTPSEFKPYTEETKDTPSESHKTSTSSSSHEVPDNYKKRKSKTHTKTKGSKVTTTKTTTYTLEDGSHKVFTDVTTTTK
mmetsp:Transcript_17291/g.19341  ORF Transcript_17291/g.19341 Transcript_17291/m.19341 type:complete len:275 (-) Transcript_17291:23-847(-)|eukprot:CAMPEP_0205828770 /NCGR_PEP_ID=MMETSP0206-20130828/36113_1 /ASSEMBLY_ACC=CAM_ASM_000279 /TAXON_ID=36767 /ORGANISM="Euplotes focardii, Strain TN1" /LENGTH=274 /DNA_ID=CAMNT_0053130897 /DNA_START=26 /DNA_END=850 /DNA_ORIENTATION=+